MTTLIRSESRLVGSDKWQHLEFDMFGVCIAVTYRRPSNTENSPPLYCLVTSLLEPDSLVILVAHPRLTSESKRLRIVPQIGSLHVIDPLPYLSNLKLLGSSAGVTTDSGGLQREVFLMGIPSITIRLDTEWPEMLGWGMTVLNCNLLNLREINLRQVENPISEPFGDGYASAWIVESVFTPIHMGL